MKHPKTSQEFISRFRSWKTALFEGHLKNKVTWKSQLNGDMKKVIVRKEKRPIKTAGGSYSFEWPVCWGWGPREDGSFNWIDPFKEIERAGSVLDGHHVYFTAAEFY